jgi:hypothetical protein
MSLTPLPPVHDAADLPPQARGRLGRASLTPGDDSAEYEDLLAWAAATVTPGDALEWIWLKDVVDLVWDARRLRRARAGLLAVARAEALKRLDLGGTEAEAEAEQARVPDSKVELLALAGHWRVAPQGFVAEAIEAEIFRDVRGWVDKLDRSVTLVERRRDAMLRELERRRDTLARRLRPVIAAAGGNAAPAVGRA